MDKGWLEPLPEVPNDGGRASRRFAVVQSDKVRPIDNYSESQVNDGVTITNKCTVDGVDTIAATVCEFMKGLRQAKRQQLRPQERLPPTCSVRLITEVGQTGSVRSGRKERPSVFSNTACPLEQRAVW